MDYSVTGYYFKLFSHCADLESCHEMIFITNNKIPRDNLPLICCQIVRYAIDVPTEFSINLVATVIENSTSHCLRELPHRAVYHRYQLGV